LTKGQVINLTENYKLAWDKIKEARYILIITHINPDPDTLTCALALSFAFEQNKIKHKIYNNNKKLPENLRFLKNYNKIVDKVPEFYDLIISVDCGDKNRFFRQHNDRYDDSITLINIDHHISNDNFGDINIVDPNSASTAELVYDLLDVNGVEITKDCAEALYVGIYTDTLAFTTNRTNNRTFKKIGHIVESGANPDYISEHLVYKDSLAKYRLVPRILDSLELHYEGRIATIELRNEWIKSTGADMEDAESALNMVSQIGIVDIVIFLRQGNTRTRVSLRGKNDADVSKIANDFEGGGHIRAAGCTVNTTDINEAKKILLDYIGKSYEL
jgi:phosphoesterase RecJ-like protein